MISDWRTPTRRTVLATLAVPLAGCAALQGDSFPADAPAPPDRLATVADTFVERVHAGEYATATEPFTDDLAAELPAEELESVWTEQVGHLGDYRAIEERAHETREGFDVVYVRVGMTDGEYDLRVAIDDRARIAGVYIIAVRG